MTSSRYGPPTPSLQARETDMIPVQIAVIGLLDTLVDIVDMRVPEPMAWVLIIIIAIGFVGLFLKELQEWLSQ